MPAAVNTFLQTVLRSGLLGRNQLEAILRTVPRAHLEDPESLAQYLIKHGVLSRFQAHKLLNGTSLGLVLGPFQVLAPIGKGGMGTVYLARDSRDQQLVALKVLPPKRARAEERLLARFQREMELSRRVGHPHLAWTYEVGVYQGVYYIAMEYIPGKSLFRLVNEHGPLSPARAARILAEVASALDHAHGQGVIHRDLKPSNILVTPHDHAKVLDLGLAMMQGEDEIDPKVVGGQGYVVGTMDYIAPEQTTDAAGVDARSDLYGLGCSLYFALTGQPPFPGGTTREKIHRHRIEQAVPVSLLNRNVPFVLESIVDRLMSKRPEDRYASAAEVEQELRACAADEVVLPLDQRGDREYQEAVDALATGDAATGLTSAELPPVPARDGNVETESNVAVPHSAGRALLTLKPSWPLHLVVLGLWLLVLAAISLVSLTYLWIRR